MVDTFLIEEVAPKPWRGVTVSEQRSRFLEDYQPKYYSVSKLAKCFGIFRTTTYTHSGQWSKWINALGVEGALTGLLGQASIFVVQIAHGNRRNARRNRRRTLEEAIERGGGEEGYSLMFNAKNPIT